MSTVGPNVQMADKPKKKVHPRKSRRVVTDTAIAVALGKSGGVLYGAAKALGITRQSLSERIANCEELQAAYKEAVEQTSDMIETKLLTAAKKGAGWAVRLYLTNKCRDRGYGQKIEISGSLHNTGEVHVLELPANGRDDSTDENNQEDDNDEA